MKTTVEHTSHKEIISDIKLLNSELRFLLKILRHCYSADCGLAKIRLLDAYWKGFEESIGKLNQLLTKIQKEDYNIELYKDGLIDFDKVFSLEKKNLAQFNPIEREVRELKTGFYEFINQHNLF